MKNSFDFEKLPMMGKITFFFLGVGSLVGWNAILTGLDFFQINLMVMMFPLCFQFQCLLQQM